MLASLLSLRQALADFFSRSLAGGAKTCSKIDGTLLVTSALSRCTFPSGLVEVAAARVGGVGLQVLSIKLFGFHILVRLILLLLRLLGLLFIVASVVLTVMVMMMLLLAIRPVQAFVGRRSSEV